MELVQVIKALGDETRLRILNILRKTEACVGEIEYILGIQQSNASRHLSKLHNANIITYNKKAQWVYYKINDSIIVQYPFIKQILDNQLEQIQHCEEDLRRLKQYNESGMTCEHLKQNSSC